MSRYTWQIYAAVVPVSMLVLFLAGCAKEPATTMALAPSPGGVAGGSTSSSEEGGGQGSGGAGGGQDVTARGGGRSDFAAGGGGAATGGGGAAGGGAAGAGGAAGGGATGAGGAAGGGATGRGGAAGGGAIGAGQSGAQAMVAAARPQPKEFTAATSLQDIHFDFDRYEIRSEAAQVLSANAEWLREHPRSLILIEGHCDDRGTNEYNLALGNHRAESAMKYLIAQGVAASRMTTISYGEERPLCTDETEACWAKNRRAHFLVKRQ